MLSFTGFTDVVSVLLFVLLVLVFGSPVSTDKINGKKLTLTLDEEWSH